MRQKNLDLLLAVIIATLNILWALLPEHIPVVGILLALPLVFVLPGYTLSEVMFHRTDVMNHAPTSSHRLLLSLALSLALDILCGFILNLFAAGLQALSWAVLLGLLTVVFSLLAAFLRQGTLFDGTRPPQFRFTIFEYILFTLAIFVAILSIEYSAISAAQQPYPGFTQLWILPSVQNETPTINMSSSVSRSPEPFASLEGELREGEAKDQGGTCAVRIGVRSFETTSVAYRLVISINGVRIKTLLFVLAPQQEWDKLVSVAPTAAGNVPVEVQLYRLDQPKIVYREVHITLNACSSHQQNAL